MPAASPALQRLVVAFAGAGAAESLAVAVNLFLEVDAFATVSAHNAFALVTRQFLGRYLDLHPLYVEQITLGHLAIGKHLLLIFAFDFRMHLACEDFGGFFGGDADGSAGFKIDKRG